ncbi:MAG: prepilin-type N-terminal cleavage/methylation domain-containing protein [Verrucomicrobiota bacterium]
MNLSRQRWQTVYRRHAGFTLIEVALAVGIFAFAGVALIGLFSIGLKNNRDSIEELEATTLSQSLLNIRKVSPTMVLPNFALPPLDQPAETPPASPVFLAADGTLANSAATARFGLIYRIRPVTAALTSSVYLCLYWPAAAAPDNAQGRCEIISTVKLP